MRNPYSLLYFYQKCTKMQIFMENTSLWGKNIEIHSVIPYNSGKNVCKLQKFLLFVTYL